MEIIGDFLTRSERTYDLFVTTREMVGFRNKHVAEQKYQIQAHKDNERPHFLFTNLGTGECYTVTYERQPDGTPIIACECWGFLRWKRCKHSGIIADLATRFLNHHTGDDRDRANSLAHNA